MSWERIPSRRRLEPRSKRPEELFQRDAKLSLNRARHGIAPGRRGGQASHAISGPPSMPRGPGWFMR
jgi:hypothetical protein